MLCFSIIPNELDMRSDHTKMNHDRRIQHAKQATEERSVPALIPSLLCDLGEQDHFSNPFLSCLSLGFADYSIQP